MSGSWTVVACHAGQAAGEPPRLDPAYCCFRLRVGPSPIHRWGVFAEEAIPPRRKVIEYTGERLSAEQAESRLGRPMDYLFAVDAEWTVDGAAGGSGAEYINHGCDPNLRIWVVRGHILYVSRRAIAAGEELTVDYKFRASQLVQACSCGAENCRGTMNRRR